MRGPPIDSVVESLESFWNRIWLLDYDLNSLIEMNSNKNVIPYRSFNFKIAVVDNFFSESLRYIMTLELTLINVFFFP